MLMNKLMRPTIGIILLSVALTSCKNNAPEEAKYIPKNATFVLAIDPLQMQDKLEKGGINMDSLFGKIFKNDDPLSEDRVIFTKLKDSAGINWSKKIYLFVLQKTNEDNSQSNTFSAMGSLQDAGKIEHFFKTQKELTSLEIKKEKNFSYLIHGEGGILAWNDKVFIASMYTHILKPVYDTAEMTFKKPGRVDSEKEMKQQVELYFNQKESESILKVDVFANMFKEKADGYMFTSANSSIGVLSAMPLQIPKLEELIKDNFSASTLHFDEGRILAKSTSFTNPVLSHLLEKYAGPTVNMSMIENYPSNEINGIVMASFNPEIFSGILKQLEVEGLVNSFLDKSNLSIQDIYKALKGDIAVVVSDLGMAQKEPGKKTDERTMIKKHPIGKMILNASIGDKASFNKLMAKAMEQGLLVKVNNTYKASGLLSKLGIYIQSDEKNFIVASDSLTCIQYLAGSNKLALSSDIIARLKNKSTVFYLDISKTFKGFNKDTSGSFNHSVMTASETFKDLFASSDNFDGKSIKASFEIRMQNQQQNSLVTLTRLITDIAIDIRLQAKKEKELEDRAFQSGFPAIIRTN